MCRLLVPSPCAPAHYDQGSHGIGERIDLVNAANSPRVLIRDPIRQHPDGLCLEERVSSVDHQPSINSVFQKAAAKRIYIKSSHIPGQLNTRANWLSRNVDPKSYHLDPAIFREACRHFRFNPDVDLFANRASRQTQKIFLGGSIRRFWVPPSKST